MTINNTKKQLMELYLQNENKYHLLLKEDYNANTILTDDMKKEFKKKFITDYINKDKDLINYVNSILQTGKKYGLILLDLGDFEYLLNERKKKHPFYHNFLKHFFKYPKYIQDGIRTIMNEYICYYQYFLEENNKLPNIIIFTIGFRYYFADFKFLIDYKIKK